MTNIFIWKTGGSKIPVSEKRHEKLPSNHMTYLAKPPSSSMSKNNLKLSSNPQDTTKPAGMRSTSCLKNVTPPSATLLRFLRSQSESLCFSSQLSVESYSPRGFGAPSYRSAILEANLLNLDFLFPRSASRCRTPPGVSNSKLKAVGFRNASSTPPKLNWFKKIWKRGECDRQQSTNRPPYDSSTENEMFGHGRSVLSKAINEPRLRCTELDEYGNVVLASGEFKKTELIARVLLPLSCQKSKLI